MKDQRLQEAGLFLIIVATPLVFFPISYRPFIDPKLVPVALGSLFLWLGRPFHNRRVTLVLGGWVAILAVSGLLGADRWHSLMGTERQSTSLLLLSLSAYLAAAGTGLSEQTADRMRNWVLVAALIVASTAALLRVMPGSFAEIPPGLSLTDSTLGQKVVVDGMAAAGVAAVLGSRLRPIPVALLTLLLAAAMGTGGGRIGWVATFTAVIVVAIRQPDRRRGALAACLLALVASFALWSMVAEAAHPPGVGSSAREFARLDEGSSRSRLYIYTAALRATARRPVLGWGPGNTAGAWLSSASLEETEMVERRIGDAHNLFLESAVTTGIIGLLALTGVLGLFSALALRAPRTNGWATGVFAALFVYHFFQPLNVVLTPLMFLALGVAASHGSQAPGSRLGHPSGRSLAGAALALFLVLATMRLTASVFEQVGRTYFSPWSFEQALRFEPHRASAAHALALSLALDGRGGDPEAAAQARALVARNVSQHPWHPEARLVAADVETLLRNDLGSDRWLRLHLERFPNDPEARRPLGLQ